MTARGTVHQRQAIAGGGAAGAALFDRIAAGDSPAVRECVQRFGGLVWSLARRWIDDATEAEDAVQEIFIDLWRSAARYDPARASEAGFVAMIARRRLIDRARKRQRTPAFEAFGEGTDLADDEAELRAERQVQADAAREVLGRLTPAQRTTLELSLLEGRTHEEIARSTAMPLGTVKSHIRRGLLRARALLGVVAEEGGEA